MKKERLRDANLPAPDTQRQVPLDLALDIDRLAGRDECSANRPLQHRPSVIRGPYGVVLEPPAGSASPGAQLTPWASSCALWWVVMAATWCPSSRYTTTKVLVRGVLSQTRGPHEWSRNAGAASICHSPSLIRSAPANRPNCSRRPWPVGWPVLARHQVALRRENVDLGNSASHLKPD